ncbi:regulatory protein RecX [Salmonirosea aquatica]|uniref:Regulatory protein RecX n=1 Tax=Salmonirosea aquatica TaxID=2654236 RepID=A0A7C9BFW8_9BACT|nr:RecX family transcriptional regulator [Cytophagaceae bacterium SJW1-29]
MDRLSLQRAAAFCAYQERTPDEVRQRLAQWEVVDEAADEIIAELISLNYLSQERFAKTYVSGKFRIKKWGKLRIRQELARRGLDDASIRQGMEEINDSAYEETLRKLLAKKEEQLLRSEPDAFKRKQKLVRFALSKGYESGVVWKIVNEVLGN